MEQDSTAQSKAGQGAAITVGPKPPWRWRFAWRSDDFQATVSGLLERELTERAGFHWLAVFFAVGALAYFSLPSEPIFAALLVAMLVVGAAAGIAYWRGSGWRILTIAAVCLAGATAAKLRVDNVATPHVEQPLYVEMTARVVKSESRVERRPRLVLDQIASEQVAESDMPHRLRISLPASYGLPPLGSRIAIPARLMPVPGPVAPGGYDPRRAAFFEGIGASGFSLGRWEEVSPPPRMGTDLLISRIRSALVARIRAVEPGEAGAVAAALLVGERSGLSEETNESLRVSGLAHILSISGLHMMLIAGTAFFTIRALLALSPRLTLTQPIRKWAAIGALLAVTVYLALSGGGAATVRAYVMAAIVFSAILIDRPAISMRNLAIAAFIVLALEPEGIMEPGFQMSFAAVAALIATWEVWRERDRRRLADHNLLPGFALMHYAARAVAGVALTTLVAGLATAPFAAYHFERVASYSLLGNLIAAPLVSFIIMPFGLLTLTLMPLGLEAAPLTIMARGIELLLAASDWVAALPGADVSAPPIAPLSLFLIAAGILWLCLWRFRWRLLGLPLMGVGLALIPVLHNPPDMLVAPDGTAVAVRDVSGVLRVSGSRAGSYVIDQFFDRELGPAPAAAELRVGVRCDPTACLLNGKDGTRVSHVIDPAAFAEDCRRADIIVTPLVAPADCLARVVIDASKLERSGSHALRLPATEGGAFNVTTERSAFPRPWQSGGQAARSTRSVNTSAAIR